MVSASGTGEGTSGTGPRAGRPGVLVLGVGDESLTDEGLGVVAARRLARWPVPGVEVVVGNAPGLSLVEVLEDRDSVIFLDAVAPAGARPGEIVVLRDDEIRGAPEALMSLDRAGVGRALREVARAGRAPRQVAVVGMVPASLDTGYGLSQAVWIRLVGLVGAAQAMLREWRVPDA